VSGTVSTPLGTPVRHPLYVGMEREWRRLAEAYEGLGGFLDGTNLVPHPREFTDWQSENPSQPTKKLIERRRLARYENFAAPMVESKLAALFRRPPIRRVTQAEGSSTHPWLAWADDNVDGAGSTLSQFLATAWRLAAVFGHVVVLMDRRGGKDDPQTLADQGTPVLRLYTPLDAIDWLTDDDGALSAVKLVEAAPRTSLDQPVNCEAYRLRYITRETFRVMNQGTVGREGAHGFGRLPVSILYAKRRATIPMLGQSALGSSRLHYDLFDLTSELRELMRKQLFSILNVPLGTGDNAPTLEQARALMGDGTIGTTAPLFSYLPAAYISPDVRTVEAYQKELDRLLRNIFRMAGMPWEADSRDAESEGSRKLKREDLNQTLAAHADEVQRTEREIAELFFRGQFGERWKREWDRVKPEIKYADDFSDEPFTELLEQAQAILAIPALADSPTFQTELGQRMVSTFLADAPEALLVKIRDEISKAPTPDERRRRDANDRIDRLGKAFAEQPSDES
jgi:hypothetical protein